MTELLYEQGVLVYEVGKTDHFFFFFAINSEG